MGWSTGMKSLEAYRAVREALKNGNPTLELPPIEPTVYAVQSRAVSATELKIALECFNAVQGWGCWQSTVMICDGEHLHYREAGAWRKNVTRSPMLTCIDEDWTQQRSGRLLSAELVSSEPGHSLHIRQRDSDAWLINEYRETTTSASPPPTQLAHDAQLIGNWSTNARLRYRVYWSHDSDRGWVHAASRLCRIESL